MKRVTIFLMGILAALVVLGPGPAGAADDGGMIAGAGAGAFPGGAAFAGVALSDLHFGQAVLTAPDGTATGTFYAALQGLTQEVTVEGRVDAGAVMGVASFSGTATVSLGDGTPPLPAVPFHVALAPDGLQLTLDATLLPAVTLSAGAIAIE
jgi:hypothetical protein